MSFYLTFEFAVAACGMARSARYLKLLDDEDTLLVDKSPPNKLEHLCYRPLLQHFFVIFILRYPYTKFLVPLILIYYLFPLLWFIMPYVILRLGHAPFDSNFRCFLKALKRQEICLFSTNYFTSSALLLRSTRIRYFTAIREQIALFEKASRKIAKEEGKETENALLANFINDDMRELIAVNGPLDDDHLSIVALRNSWQYLFLARSEFLRLSILAHYPATEHAVFDFTQLRIVFITLTTLLKTFSFGAIYKAKTQASSERPAVDRHVNYGSAAALTSHESVTYQLEWILESLYMKGSIPMGDNAQKIIQSLRGIISIIEGESQKKNADKSSIIESTANEIDIKDDDRLKLSPTPSLYTDEFSNDVQIFEMYTGNDDKTNEEQAVGSSSTGMDDTAVAVQVDTRPFLLELKDVISRRKDVFIEREIAALARLRGVPVEQIPREELDRDIFAEPKKADDCDVSQPTADSRSQVSSGPFGHALNVSDLAAIIAQRHLIVETAAIGDVLENDRNNFDKNDDDVVFSNGDNNSLLADDNLIELN